MVMKVAQLSQRDRASAEWLSLG